MLNFLVDANLFSGQLRYNQDGKMFLDKKTLQLTKTIKGNYKKFEKFANRIKKTYHKILTAWRLPWNKQIKQVQALGFLPKTET